MNPLILLFSIFVNFAAFALYLLFWFVLPTAAGALILFLLGRGLLLLTRKLRGVPGGRSQ